MCLFAPFLSSAQSESTLKKLLDLELAIFQSENQELSAELLLQKSEVWMNEANYEEALNTLERINSYAISDSLRNELVELESFIYYLSSEFALGKNSILEASLEDWFEPSQDLALTEVLIEVELGNLEEAKSHVSKLNPEIDTEQLFDVKKFKKEEKAFNLSIILPGSGQMYAGYFFKGLTSLALQSALMYGGVKGLQNRYFFSQSLPAVAIFQGFYFGGANYAKRLVLERNQKIKTDLSAEIIAHLK